MTLPLSHREARLEHWQAIGGFTLIELLVTIVVLSILLGLAVPAFRSLMQNDQQWVQTNNLILSLNAARSEAIKNDTTSAAIAGGGGAQICTSSDGVACTGAPWDPGWIVLRIDPANPPRGAKRLQVAGALSSATPLSESNDNRSLSFLPNGTLNTSPTALIQPPATRGVALKMCDARGAAFARYLQVTLMGRAVVSPNVGQDLNQVALACP